MSARDCCSPAHKWRPSRWQGTDHSVLSARARFARRVSQRSRSSRIAARNARARSPGFVLRPLTSIPSEADERPHAPRRCRADTVPSVRARADGATRPKQEFDARRRPRGRATAISCPGTAVSGASARVRSRPAQSSYDRLRCTRTRSTRLAVTTSSECSASAASRFHGSFSSVSALRARRPLRVSENSGEDACAGLAASHR